MKILTGIDIIEISRIKKSLETYGNVFRDKIFTSREILYCESKKLAKFQSYACRFSSKEAVSKALGTGMTQGANFLQIEISNDQTTSKPYVELSGIAKKYFNSIGGTEISISLSHCKEYAVASVIIYTKE